jgi:hypothetical protein
MLFKSLATLAASAALVAGLPTAPPPPSGGVDANATAPPPQYVAVSDFDFQSLNLALNFENIELDLFHYGLARFSAEEFDAAGINAADRFLIEFMADQEVGHATLLNNILQTRGAKQCEYRYNFNDIKGWIETCALITRMGESGVIGFLSHLDSRPSATLLQQAIHTEARQQYTFRQFAGSFPMEGVWFETGISQAMAWTLLSPFLVSCPAENPRIEWNTYPYLHILNNPNLTDPNFPAAISTNRTQFIAPNDTVLFAYDAPGQNVSYNHSYTTAVGSNVTDLTPKFCHFVSQLNTTISPFNSTGNGTGSCPLPGGFVFGDDAINNGTLFVMLTSEDTFVTPYNLSLLNDVIVAGPAILIAG